MASNSDFVQYIADQCSGAGLAQGEMNKLSQNVQGPTTAKERHVILDALRGLALLGIALANFPEFALWTFLSTDEQQAMTTAGIDSVVRYMQYLLVDGKFYTIFSLLFGVGFSLILSRHPVSLFVRRMLILAVIGFCHLMFIWSGDILLLYACGGLLLPLFIRLKDRTLLTLAVVLIMLPVGLDALTEFAGIDFARPFYDAWWAEATRQGITEENFATWLRDADSYPQMFAFLCQGACERLWEFVEGHRLPKVVGLFMLGYLIGKHRLYARLEELPLRKACTIAFAVGVPISILYAWSATHGHPWGQTVHSLLYAVSVVPMAAGYVTAMCLWYQIRPSGKLFTLHSSLFTSFAAPGRMALSNYISQSLVGVLLFYGLGFGWGCSFGLVYVELTAFAVFVLQIVVCKWWFRHFRFGPLEWVWRMLTYGRCFQFKVTKEDV